jgi:hypothetical protein
MPGGDYREYKLLDNTWRIRRPADFPDSVPCYHPRARYLKIGGGARYDTLMRSPANAAVTSAQYALRSILGHAPDEDLRRRLHEAKFLAFSDSYSDMEQLAQDFDEPERNTFIDQAIVAFLERSECSLQDLTSGVIQELERYGELVSGNLGQNRSGANWVRHLNGKRAIWDEVERRFLSGNYGFQASYRPWLVREAIADIRLNTPILSDEVPILAALANFNRPRREYLMNELLDKVPNYAQVLEGLETRGIIQAMPVRQGELVYLNPAHLICSLVEEDHPIP